MNIPPFSWFNKPKKNLPPSKKVSENLLITRNNRLTRVVHWFHLVSFFLLIATGLTIYYPILATPVSGLEVSMLLHRIIGIIYIIVPLFFIIKYFHRFIIFMSDYAHWQRTDITWLLKFPLFMLSPGRVKLPDFVGKINPGQKLVGGAMLVASLLMAVSGLVRMFFNTLPLGLTSGSAAVHQVIFPLLILLFFGHVLTGSGVHPIYRGVSRAMLGDGNLRAGLVKIHWKNWLDEGSPNSSTSGWKVLFVLLPISGLIFAGLIFLTAPEIDPVKDQIPEEKKFIPGIYQCSESDISVKINNDRSISYIINEDKENIKPLTSWQAKDILINALIIEKNNTDNNHK